MTNRKFCIWVVILLHLSQMYECTNVRTLCASSLRGKCAQFNISEMEQKLRKSHHIPTPPPVSFDPIFTTFPSPT